MFWALVGAGVVVALTAIVLGGFLLGRSSGDAGAVSAEPASSAPVTPDPATTTQAPPTPSASPTKRKPKPTPTVTVTATRTVAPTATRTVRVAPDPTSPDILLALDPYSPQFQPAAEQFLCSGRDLPDAGYSPAPSGATLLVQWVLWSYYGWPLALDGEFGPQTRGAVKSYQSTFGLVPDGLVGPITWRSLRASACGG